MRGPIYVTFTPEEIAQAKEYIRKVKYSDAARLVHTPDADKAYTELVCDKLGEVAFGRVFNLPVNWRLDQPFGDGYKDFTLPNGKTVDVKTVTVRCNLDYDYKLPAIGGAKKADYFVQSLVLKDMSVGVLKGWLSRETLLTHGKPQKQWGERPVAGQPQGFGIDSEHVNPEFPADFLAGLDNRP